MALPKKWVVNRLLLTGKFYICGILSRILIENAHYMFQTRTLFHTQNTIHSIWPACTICNPMHKHTTPKTHLTVIHNSGTQITKFILDLSCHLGPPSSSVCSRNFSRKQCNNLLDHHNVARILNLRFFSQNFLCIVFMQSRSFRLRFKKKRNCSFQQ